jgi:thymidylate synthase
LEFITHYLPQYEESADDGRLNGAYGPRLFDWSGVTQIQNVAQLLKKKPSSRQAVIQLFSAADLLKDYKDVPCTCCLQFVIREEKLSLMTTMRSNDAYKGLPHDVFSFTMLQEILARMLGIEVWTYKHAVGSMHLYDTDRASAQQFLGEGWQSTETAMPAMPSGDPWSNIEQLLRVEGQLRLEGQADEAEIAGMIPYWADLGRMLQILQYKRQGNLKAIERVREAITSPIYFAFVDKIKSELQ